MALKKNNHIVFILFSFLVFTNLKAQKDTVYAQDTVTLNFESNFEIKQKTSDLHQAFSVELLYKTPAFIKDYGTGNLATISYQGTSSNQSSLFWNDINLNPSNSGTTDFSLVDSYHFDNYKLATNENNRQGSGIGADIDLMSQGISDSGFTYTAKFEVKQYNHYSLGTKLFFKDSIRTIKLSVLADGGQNDFEFYNPIIKDFESRENNKNESLSGMLSFDRLFKNKIVYFKTWNKYSDRSIPSPLLVENQEETQADSYSRNIIGIKGYLRKAEYNLFSSLIFDNYRYNNSNADILGVGKIKRNFSQLKIKQNLKYWWESKVLLFSDLQNVLLLNTQFKRKLVGFSWNNKFSIAQKIHFTTTLRKELYRLEANLPMVYDLKLDYERKQFIVYTKFQSNARKPTLNDLYWQPGGNQNLNSETSTIGFLGFKATKFIDFKIELFKGNIQQMIVWLPNNSNGVWSPQNYASVSRQGLNLSLEKSVVLNKNTLLNASTIYSYTNSIDEISDLQLIYMPLQQLKWNIGIEKSKNWSIQYNGLYSDLWYVTRDHSSFLPAFTISDIGVFKHFAIPKKEKRIKFGLKIKNAFNYSYYSIPFRPMQGRVIGASVELI